MDPNEEKAAVGKVADSLAEKHPEVPSGHIKEIVNEAYDALSGNPVRDFVPPLVGHAARERLREEHDSEATGA